MNNWHDLMKNPEDLPEIGKNVLVYFNIGYAGKVMGHGYTVSHLFRRKLEEIEKNFPEYEGKDYEEGWSVDMYNTVLAWKEIEPFKVSEDD